MADAKITITVEGQTIATEAFRTIATEAEKVGPAIGKIGAAGESAMPGTSSIANQLRSFDGILASMGIHIGPEIKAIGELGAAGGASATSLGLLAKAGFVAGAAFAGWKMGRAVAEFFDLDTVIANATAKLMGWGDVAGEIAGAKAEALARASQRIGFEVLTLTTAVQINSGQWDHWKSNITISAEAVARWRAEIARVTSAGELDSLTQDLASQNFAVKDLAERYHVSVEALQFFTRETKVAADAEKKASDVTKAHNATILHGLQEELTTRREAFKARLDIQAELANLDAEYTTTAMMQSGTRSQSEIANINASFEVQIASLQKQGRYNEEVAAGVARNWQQALAGVGVDWGQLHDQSIDNLKDIADRADKTYKYMLEHSSDFSRGAIQHQLELVRATAQAATEWGRDWEEGARVASEAIERQNAKLEETKRIAEAAAEAYRKMMATGSAFTYDLTTQAGVEQYRKMNTGMDISWSNDQLIAFASQGGTLQQLLQMGVIRMRAFANGVDNFGGGWAMVGERGPEPMYVPPGASIFPHGSGAGMSTVTNITVNLSGALATDRASFKSVVEHVFMEVARQNRLWPS